MLLYFAAAFSIAWAGVLLVAARTGLPALALVAVRQRTLVFLAMLAGPAVASAGLTLWCGGIEGLRELVARLARWQVGARWYAALLVAPLVLVLSLGILAPASPAYVPAILSGASFATTFVTAVVGGLGAGLFEELGWTGFATPRLLARYTWQRAGLLLGIVWASWHGLADYWGGIGYGALWSVHLLEWFVALCAFRMLMTWIYSQTGSLLLGALLHASFTGSQVLLWPRADAAQELIWYGLFAGVLWGVLGLVAAWPRWFPSCRASQEERSCPMWADALVPDPMFSVTHSITIDVPMGQVWPWLAQLGSGRAGWYSWDRIDNGGASSAREILSFFQQVRRGEVLPAVPGAKDAFVVERADPPRDLVLTVPGHRAMLVSWEHLLEGLEGQRTRLVVRGRVSREWKLLARDAGRERAHPFFIERIYRVLARMPRPVLVAAAGYGHRVMEARHMRGIKRRAEANAGRW